MTNDKSKRRNLTPEDYEIMHYWVGIYNEELQRVIRVLRYMEDNPIPKSAHKNVQLEFEFGEIK